MRNQHHAHGHSFTPQNIHNRLLGHALSDEYHAAHVGDGFVDRQALFCRFYVPLDGILGADWGVIVNPDSTRFGRVTFEHDFCGCPPDQNCRGDQTGDEWADETS